MMTYMMTYVPTSKRFRCVLLVPSLQLCASVFAFAVCVCVCVLVDRHCHPLLPTFPSPALPKRFKHFVDFCELITFDCKCIYEESHACGK